MSSTDSGGSTDEDASPKQSGQRALKIVNELTKWIVSGTAAAIVLWRRDIHVMWCILGSIVNVIVCKVLKRLIKAQRPGGAAKQDHGMPSSHASSLGYLSVYVASSLLQDPAQTHHCAAAGIVLALGAFMTWLRVATGYHTRAQVLVGYALGASMAVSWQHAGLTHVLIQARTQPWLVTVIYSLSTAAALAFAIKSLMGAHKDVHRLKTVMDY